VPSGEPPLLCSQEVILQPSDTEQYPE
jgi:hypothetical protein